MVSGPKRPKFVVIVGPTASGKSALGLRIAKDFNGEIISADSLTIYKNMDIGTAKLRADEREGIRHWGFDLIGPGQRFTAAEFKNYAQGAIADISARNKLPVVVGGSGLYIDALVLDFSFGEDADPQLRRKLEGMSTQRLQALIRSSGYAMPVNNQNRRHLTRTIERRGKVGTRNRKLPKNIILIGMIPEDLRHRIRLRVEQMFDTGLVSETSRLMKQYGRENLIARAKVAYGPVIEYLDGELELQPTKEHLETAHWQYARRQKTWFKRNSEINWFSTPEEAYKFIKKQLLNT